MLMTFFIGLTGYATALVAQYLGAGRKGHCELVLSQAVFLSFLATPLIWRPGRSLTTCSRSWTSRRSSSSSRSSISTFSSTERSWFCCGTASAFLRHRPDPGGDVLRPDGDAGQRRCNYVLIFGHLGFPAQGIRGAAYGTLFGSLCGLLVLLAAYLAPTNRRGSSGGFATLRWRW